MYHTSDTFCWLAVTTKVNNEAVPARTNLKPLIGSKHIHIVYQCYKPPIFSWFRHVPPSYGDFGDGSNITNLWSYGGRYPGHGTWCLASPAAFASVTRRCYWSPKAAHETPWICQTIIWCQTPGVYRCYSSWMFMMSSGSPKTAAIAK
jgi:hypothetical protein